jgi:hypothetical protein
LFTKTIEIVENTRSRNINIEGIIGANPGATLEAAYPPYDNITLIPTIGHRKA